MKTALYRCSALVVFALTLAAPVSHAETDYAQEGERRAVTAGATLIGHALPAITLKTIDGQSIDLGAFRGKRPVYLKFWATWCAPCLQQMPDFNAIHASLGDQVEVIAVNTGFNDDLAAVQRFSTTLKMSMPIIIDDGRLARALNLRVTPQHLVVGRDGRIEHVGHLDDDKLHAALRRVIDQSAAGAQSVVADAMPGAKVFRPGDAVSGVKLKTLDGKTVELGRRVSGKPLGLVFMAAWCEWYVAESRPATAQACERVRKQVDVLAARDDVEWLAVASDLWTTEDDLREYVESMKPRVKHALDQGGEVFAAFGIRSVPSVILIDADGRLSRFLGPGDSGLAEAVNRLAAQGVEAHRTR